MKFENRYISNEKIYCEYLRKVMFRQLRFAAMWLMAASVLLLGLRLINGDSIEIELIMILFSAMILVISELSGRQSLKHAKKFHNGQLPESRILFGDSVHLEEATMTMDLEYSKIKRIYLLKHSYVLQCGKALSLIAAKGRFVEGNEAAFLDFLKEKCPDAKIVGRE